MSKPAVAVLFLGLGMLASQLIAVGGVLLADWWADRVRRD